MLFTTLPSSINFYHVTPIIYQLFRSAVAAGALPISSKGINKIRLNEAQVAWSINKIMGDDEEVISKFLIMEPKMIKGPSFMLHSMLLDFT